MNIYIDENMSPYLARGFDILQKPENVKLREAINVRSIKDEFGQGAEDEEWIPLAGKQGSCIITQDYNIKRIRHQQALCEEYQLGMFYFRPPSNRGFLYWDMLKMLVKHWSAIQKIALSEARPFAYKATSRSELTEI